MCREGGRPTRPSTGTHRYTLFQRDERAASVQVGAVLLFGLAIVSLTFYQAYIVPQETRAAEFDAYQEASTDLVELQNDVVEAGTAGSRSGTTVMTGAQYPPRVWSINPSPPAGVIRTTAAGNVTVSNAVSPADSDVAEVWDGSEKNFSTNRVTFDPAYSELSGDPIAVDGTLTYRQTSTTVQPLTSQSLLIGKRLTLVTITGDVNDGGQTTSLTTEPVSVSRESVPVTGASDVDADGDPELFVTVPTEASVEQWRDRLLAPNENVENVSAVPGGVRIELNGSVTYQLHLAQVEVRERGDGGDTTAPAPHYIVRAAGQNGSITTNQTADVTAEVRDRFNNPVPGTTVTFTDPTGATTNISTNEFGQATFSWTPLDTGSDTIDATFGGGDLAREQTTFTVQVGSACPDNDPECGDGEVNEKALDAQDQFLDNGQSTDVFLDSAVDDGSTVLLNFNNTGSETWTAFEVRLISYYTGNANNQITGDYNTTTVQWSGEFAALNHNYTVASGETHTAPLSNLDDSPGRGDWLLFSVKYERADGKLSVSTYIQQVQ